MRKTTSRALEQQTGIAIGGFYKQLLFRNAIKT
jgi:hypothetical protein